MWLKFLKEKGFKQSIPLVRIEDGEEEVTFEAATAAVRRSVHFYSALQASDGHWPAESAGTLYFLPPLVTSYVFPVFMLIQDTILQRTVAV